MFDRYYCIKTFFSLENFGEIALKRLFICTYMCAEKHVACERFKKVPFQGKD